MRAVIFSARAIRKASSEEASMDDEIRLLKTWIALRRLRNGEKRGRKLEVDDEDDDEEEKMNERRGKRMRRQWQTNKLTN